MPGFSIQALWGTSLIGRLVTWLLGLWEESLIGRIFLAVARFFGNVARYSLFGRLLFADWPGPGAIQESRTGRALLGLERWIQHLGRRLQPFACGLWETSLLARLMVWCGRTVQPYLATSYLVNLYTGFAGEVSLMPEESRRPVDPALYLLAPVLGLIPVLPVDGPRLLSPTLLMVAGIWGVAALWLGRRIMLGEFAWRFSSAMLPLGFLLAVAVLSTVQSASRADSLLNLIIWATALLLFWLMVNLVRNTRDAAVVLGPVFIGAALMTAWAVYQQIVPPEVNENWSDPTQFGNLVRSFAGFGNPNYLAEYVALYLPLGVALWLQQPKRALAIAGFLGLMGLSLLLTFTRGAWLAVLIAFVIFVFMRAWRWAIPGVISGLGALAAAVLLAPQSLIVRRLVSAFTTTANTSNQYRVNLWKGAMDMLQVYWVEGAGLGAVAFEKVYSDFMLGGAKAAHAHNVFLQVFAEMGILGLIAVIWSLLAVIRLPFSAGINPRSSYVTAAVPAALVGVLVHGLVEHIWYNPTLLFTFWAVAGLGVGLALGDREGSQA